MAKYPAIEQPHIVLCEGKNAVSFVNGLIEDLLLESADFGLFQILDGKSITQLPTAIRDLPHSPGFKTKPVQSIIVLRDAENDPDKRPDKSVTEALRRYGFAVPSAPCKVTLPLPATPIKVKTAYALFPSIVSHDLGTLEDLCVKMLRKFNEKRMEISQVAVDAASIHVEKLTSPHKNRLFTYLSLTNNHFDCNIEKAIKRKVFDFKVPELQPLRDLLSQML